MFIRLRSYSHFNISLIQPYSFVSPSFAGQSSEHQGEAFRALSMIWTSQASWSLFGSLHMVSGLLVMANAFRTFRG